MRRYAAISIAIQLIDSQRRTDQGGYAVQPNTTRISSQRMKKKRMMKKKNM
jgi:hypothetical protein